MNVAPTKQLKSGRYSKITFLK
uniref:Uncharacterized protein n=1 Tax=Anguilla anguilla TaxID=7936 RepID=A0A0E9UQK6_ANGAN